METVTETEGLRDEMDKTAELAEQFGISGDDGDPEDEEVLETSAEVESSEPPETLETQEASTTSEPPGGDDDGSSEPQEQDNVQEVGGVMEREYPNPDKEVGAITDLYDNINVFVPPEVKEEIHTLYKELEYKYRREHGEEIDKHWDFYTALFRTVLRDDDLLREELGLTSEEE